MPDFPSGVPDVPDAVAGVPLASLHGVGVPQSTGLDRTSANLAALATKLGTGAATPTLGWMLAGAATTGQSGWVAPVDGPTLTVAAVDASASSRATANYACDGTADDVEITAALNALPSGGGVVRLTEGTFALAAIIGTARVGSHLVGAGMDATIIRVPNAGGVGFNTVVVQINNASCSMRDFTIDGNKANNAAQTGMFGIWANAADSAIERVKVKDSAGQGFFVTVAAAHARLASCISEGSASNAYLLRSPGASGITLVEGCIARSNAGGAGFACDNGQVLLIGCRAVSVGGASGSGSGFDFNTNGLGHAYGCEASLCAGQGFYLAALSCEVIGCQSYQNAGNGIYAPAAGGDARIAYNMVVRNAGHGILAAGSRAQVVGNRVNDNGTAADVSYWGIALDNALDVYADQNMVRQGTAFANRQYGGLIATASSGNCMVGINDVYAGGATLPFQDAGSNTRRAVKLQLDYALASDFLNGTPISSGIWTACHTAQNFRIDSPTSVVTISARGNMLANGSSDPSRWGSRILVDATTYKLGGGRWNASKVYFNPFVGAGVLALTGLSTGVHSVQVQVMQDGTAAGLGYLRATSNPVHEGLFVQVLEYQR